MDVSLSVGLMQGLWTENRAVDIGFKLQLGHFICRKDARSTHNY